MQVVGATFVVLVARDAEEVVAFPVAGGHQRVVNARCGVLCHFENRQARVGHKCVARQRGETGDCGTGVRHACPCWQGGAGAGGWQRKGPEVDDLSAVGVDHGYGLRFGHGNGDA